MEQKAPVKITLGGKERALRYSLGAAKRLKQTFGTSLFAGGFQGIDEDKLPILIYEGLRGSDSGLTIDAVEEMIDMQNLPAVLQAVMAAFGYDSTPKNEDPAAVAQTEKPEENSTLTTSGQLDATISG